MKLATYLDHAEGSSTSVGVVQDHHIHRIPDLTSMRDLIEGGLQSALALGERALEAPGTPLNEVRLLSPLQPASVRDFVAFEEHVEGVRRSIDRAAGVPDAWYDAPTFYFANPHAIFADGEVVPFPATSVARDFELEVAVVVGREGRSLSVEDAADHIFGYTILNDWSARDLQGREMQVGLGPAKGKDFATTLGPWLVTADELEQSKDAEGFLDLECAVAVNGTEIGTDLLSNMGWTFEAMIAYASRDSRVVPSDVLGSGTTGNGGCLAELWGLNGRENPPALRDGDIVTVTVQGLGTLTNTVASALPAPTLPPFRRPSRRRSRSATTQ